MRFPPSAPTMISIRATESASRIEIKEDASASAIQSADASHTLSIIGAVLAAADRGVNGDPHPARIAPMRRFPLECPARSVQDAPQILKPESPSHSCPNAAAASARLN